MRVYVCMYVCMYVCIRREATKPGQEWMKGGVWGCDGEVCVFEGAEVRHHHRDGLSTVGKVMCGWVVANALDGA